jgi:hypothetical protein
MQYSGFNYIPNEKTMQESKGFFPVIRLSLCTQLYYFNSNQSIQLYHACQQGSLNRPWQSKEDTLRALGMAGIEPTPSQSGSD